MEVTRKDRLLTVDRSVIPFSRVLCSIQESTIGHRYNGENVLPRVKNGAYHERLYKAFIEDETTAQT